MVSERPGGALKPLQVAWSSWAEQFSGGTRAPLQYCAMTGEFPGVKLLLPATPGALVKIELAIVNCVPAGTVPAARSSVRRPTSQ